MKKNIENIELLVNGEELTTKAGNLAGLLIELQRDGDVLATALNGEFVPRVNRTTTVLRDGDQIELVAPMSGG